MTVRRFVAGGAVALGLAAGLVGVAGPAQAAPAGVRTAAACHVVNPVWYKVQATDTGRWGYAAARCMNGG
jgi:hypothetical protein